MMSATLSNTNLAIDIGYGIEQFTGVVGLKPKADKCLPPLLLSYVDGRLTGQFVSDQRVLRSLSDASLMVPETRNLKQGLSIGILHDRTPVTLAEGDYLATLFPGHDVSYASAQYDGMCGGCHTDDCSKVWSVTDGINTLSTLYIRQQNQKTAIELFKAIGTTPDVVATTQPQSTDVGEISLGWVEQGADDTTNESATSADEYSYKDPAIDNDDLAFLDLANVNFS